jgi:hypothetical protein
MYVCVLVIYVGHETPGFAGIILKINEEQEKCKSILALAGSSVAPPLPLPIPVATEGRGRPPRFINKLIIVAWYHSDSRTHYI